MPFTDIKIIFKQKQEDNTMNSLVFTLEYKMKDAEGTGSKNT